MLSQLEIRNVALIDEVNIEFGDGLNILTGETGAGKSIIIDSINALLGERFSRDIIRTGREKATIEAVFHADNQKLSGIFGDLGIEPEEDGTLIISREFASSGKNTCRLNGKLITMSVLREIGEQLLDVHGQYENQSLLKTSNHIGLLDAFCGEGLYRLMNEYVKILGQYKEIKNRLKELTGDKKERERKIDLLKFQIDEISKAKLKTGEEETWERQKLLLSNSERIVNTLSCVYELLFTGNNIKNSASDNINEALSEITGIAKLDQKFEVILKRIQELSYQFDDITADIRNERDSVEFDPEMLEQAEERLDLIYRLKKKYGNTIFEILEYCKKVETELDDLSKSEETVSQLQTQLKDIDNKLFEIAEKIHIKRMEAALLLEEKISMELEDLEMKRTQFKVNIEIDDRVDMNGERKYLNNGLDRVEFLISPNAGEPLKPLSKIASGGEMSRIMLAIKSILAAVDEIPTMIFDEIDIGIGGKASQKVGEKLSYISGNHQVICVTHLAQIASMADNHFIIIKVSNGESTSTVVKKLAGGGICEEIARILDGANISDITRKHAEQMLYNARALKKSKNL